MTSIKPPVFFEYSANDPYLYDVQFSVNSATDMCNKLRYPRFRSPVCRQSEDEFFSDICIIPIVFEPVLSFFFSPYPFKCADTRLYQCTYFTPPPTAM